MSEYIVEIDKLSCKYGYKYLIKDISWKIKAGEHWAVFGMNGCGKTTLLSIIAGFNHFTSGKIKVFGKEFSNETMLDIRSNIGWVSASFFDKYYSREAIMDIVLSGKTGTLCNESYASLAERKYAKEILKELGLGNHLDCTFDMLSKGERQNVLIARSLYTNPKILVLDEPCTGLDIYNREYLFKTIDALAERKDLTIIYVTHYVEEIKPLFNKTLLIKNGHVFASGDTQELFTSENMTKFLDYSVDLKRDENNNLSLTVKNLTSNIVKLLDGGVNI